MTSLKNPAWALCAALASISAHANRPLNTDTADTIAPHRCQFEPYLALNRSSGSPSEHGTTLQLNCGVSARTQLGISGTGVSSDGESAQAVAFGGKSQWVELADGTTGVSIGYGLNAGKSNGSSWSHDNSFAYLIATRQLAPDLLGHVNLGTSRSQAAHQTSTTWAAAFEWTLVPLVVLSGETFGDDHSRPWASTGVWWGVRENFSVNMSLGMQTSPPRTRQITASFNIEF